MESRIRKISIYKVFHIMKHPLFQNSKWFNLHQSLLLYSCLLKIRSIYNAYLLVNLLELHLYHMCYEDPIWPFTCIQINIST